MKRSLLIPALLAVAPCLQAADVGISVTVDRPGFYGSIDIGDMRPRTINVQPVIIAPVTGVRTSPLYLHVPPGHARKWSRHCGRYNACGRPVYFVREDWYEREYLPRKSGKMAARGGQGHAHGKGQGRRD